MTSDPGTELNLDTDQESSERPGTSRSAPNDCPVVTQDLTDWAFNQDPFPELERWRSLGSVVYNAYHGHYMVTSYRNCAKVLSDLVHFNSQKYVKAFVGAFGGITMEALDTPRHHEMRGVWAPDFTRAGLESRRSLVEAMVAARVDPFVERIRAGEVLDAIPDMTRGIPTLVIAHMLGIEPEMFEQFSDWSDAIGASVEGALDRSPRGDTLVAEGRAATRELNQYLASAIERRRHDGPGGCDLVSTMVFHDFAASMEESEIVASNTQLVFAGNETTAKLMASTLVALGQNPDQRRALAADRSRVPQAFEEVHRWMTLTQAIPRFACSDESAIDGVPIPNGARVDPLPGAANRDPTRWKDPAAFDIFREQRQHLGFGFGMHVCLGLNLARLEAQVWLNRLLDLLPDYELSAPIDYGRNFVLRGPTGVTIAKA